MYFTYKYRIALSKPYKETVTFYHSSPEVPGRVGWGDLGQWGNLGHFGFSVISLTQNGLTAGAASMDCISPLPSEMNAAVPWAFCLLDLRKGRSIFTISEFFLKIKLS